MMFASGLFKNRWRANSEMNNSVSLEMMNEVINATDVPLFYKCPFGGFASLRPGVCPKCEEVLTPVGQSASRIIEGDSSQAHWLFNRESNCVTDIT